MRVLIKVHYVSTGGNTLQKGDWQVNPRQYRENPDTAAVAGALEFIKFIKRQNPYPIEVTKVLYADDVDITDKVKGVGI